MVQLYLSKAVSDGHVDGGVVKARLSFLQRLETIIWSALSSGGYDEARLWLCDTVSCIQCISPDNQCDLFLELLRSKPPKRDVAARLVQMILDKSPEKVGPVIAKKSYLLEKFFEGNPRRILQWFDNFASVVGESGHKKGARALSQFAFVNRDICWEELEWKGRHGQSPAVVATKPHYFHDLDVLQTVENFLEYVPDFWTSNELAESLKDGEIFKIDTKYFVDQFVMFLFEENLEDMWAVIEEYLTVEQFSYLAQHLLILLDENDLLTFLRSITIYIGKEERCKRFGYPTGWLEYLLATCIGCITINELFLFNAVISHGRQLLRFVCDEEHEEEKGKLEELLVTSVSFSDADHWALIRECAKLPKKQAIKLVGLQSWFVHYRLSKECKSPQSCELVFATNGIDFRKADDYSLISSKGYSTVHASAIADEDSDGSGGRKGKRNKKRRRRKYVCDDWSDDEMEFKKSNGWQGLECGDRSWLLSTDGYSSTWHNADLPEQLSRYCFLTWMKWIQSDW